MKKYRRLTRADRIIIERGLSHQKSKSEIADELGVHRSTICREISRNKALHSDYKWRGAQAKAARGRDSIFSYKRKIDGLLEEVVLEFLEQKLSPQQISERLKLEDTKWSISHETIYNWIYRVAPNFKKYLRWGSRKRNKRIGKRRRGIIPGPRKSICERPIECDLRLENGHWERDLLEGQRGGPALLVIHERRTRYTIIRKVESKHCNLINEVTASALKNQNVISMTNDNGIEFGCGENLEKILNAPVYYCTPYSSWERGSVENVNGLIRQYFPKRTDFSVVSDDEIDRVQQAINLRPKKELGYRSPLEVHTNRRLRLVKSEGHYQARSDYRERVNFKRSMIEQVGYYLEVN